ncbi:mediator of RNA polymerase II transcription subunit 6 [Drosophila grimshawi]|uniref:Mediator of RNA polymerase II transcription subunit 6 n=1 Tax=Drosophila grimshawi TaxID=7222 RepID=B4JV61_DROGR|nr:mediator of RNA polymerase II transcription subunit 6 [Drosophila grimshawi]EDV91381.1 GH14337 [Drosophila grimshawi]
MANRQMAQPPENHLRLSWHDTQMIATLSPQTVMDYFCRKSNPFYDHMCNNETIRMQRLGVEHLHNMLGLEYILLHVAEPILYVIRKQHRHNPAEATPIADYYIIGGTIYKAPDLANVINARVLNTVVNLQSAFEEASSYARYHPNKGYTWDFSSNKILSDKSKADKKDSSATKDDSSGTLFQKQRVDMLLAELLRKFPPPIPPMLQNLQPAGQLPNAAGADGGTATNSTENHANGPLDIATESIDMKPPPEKKSK